MRIRKKTLWCFTLAVLLFFAGTSMVYAMACPTGHWPLTLNPTKGWDEWSGTVFVVPEIVGSPGPCDPIEGFNEQYVKANLFLKLTTGKNKKAQFMTYSDVAVADDESEFFCIIADYCSGRLGEAILNFLQTEVDANIEWISVEEESGNILEQLLSNGPGLDPDHPLYFQLKITVQVPSN